MKHMTNTMNDTNDLFGMSKLFQSIQTTTKNKQYQPHHMITFDDIGGFDSNMFEIKEIVTYLQHPFHYHQIGATTPKGILLYGPPETGKTLLAHAMANKAHLDCFLTCSASEFVETWCCTDPSLFYTAHQQAKRKTKQKQKHQTNHMTSLLFHLFLLLLCNHFHRTSYNHCHQEKVDVDVDVDVDKDDVNRPYSAMIFINELDALSKHGILGIVILVAIMNGNKHQINY
jgi:ATPase family associated with various cellular activities (AAA)